MGVQLIRYRRMGSSPAPAPPPPTTDNPTEKRTTVSTLSHLLMLTWKTKILMTRKTMRLELKSLESSLVQFSQNQLSQETQLQHLLVKRACLGEIIRFCKMLTRHLFTHFSESGSRR